MLRPLTAPLPAAEHSPPRVRVLAAGVAIALAVLLGAGLQIWRQYQLALDHARQYTSHYAATLAANAGQTMKAAELALDRVLADAATLGIDSDESLRRQLGTAAFHGLLKQQADALLAVDVISIVALNGDLVNFSRRYPARSDVGAAINLADRDYFQAHLADPALGAMLSKPVRNKSNGKWTFYLSRKIRSSSGQMLGVALVGIESRYFADFYRDTRLSDVNGVGLFRRDAVMLARHPWNEEQLGKAFQNGPAYQALQNAPKATFVTRETATQPGNRSLRVISAHAVDGYPMFVGVNADEAFVLGAWKSEAIFLGGFASLFSALVFGLSLWNQALQARNDRQRRHVQSVFELSPDGFVAFDSTGRLQMVNPAFQRMTGLALSELHRLAMAEFDACLRGLIDADPAAPGAAAAAPFSITALGQGLDAAAHSGVTLKLRHPEPRTLKLTLRLGPKGWPQLIVYARDVTREDEIDRLKNEFVATAAHELRTPLASIHGFAELLLLRSYDEATRRDMTQTILNQSGVLVHLVNELLDLGRIEAGGGRDFKLISQPLRPLIASTLKELRVAGDARRPDAELPDDLPQVEMDAMKIRQALMNVLGNAYKYSPGGGAIEVRVQRRTKPTGDEVGIAVTDHGIGLRPEDQARVFERFFRADASGTLPGAGLGLALVQEIMRIHRGSVELQSTLGVGTTVTLWLPIAAAGAPVASRPVADPVN